MSCILGWDAFALLIHDGLVGIRCVEILSDKVNYIIRNLNIR